MIDDVIYVALPDTHGMIEHVNHKSIESVKDVVVNGVYRFTKYSLTSGRAIETTQLNWGQYSRLIDDVIHHINSIDISL